MEPSTDKAAGSTPGPPRSKPPGVRGSSTLVRSGTPGSAAPGGSASRKVLRRVKYAVFFLALLPLLVTAWDAYRGRLGANPISEVLNRLGWWTFVILLAGLACTPAKILFQVSWPLQFRRMLGLIAFSYASLHFLFYLGVDQFFDLAGVFQDVAKRPFIMVGFAALLTLIPLALTSTKASVRRLGFRKWKRLHRLVYATGVLASIHFLWRVKADRREPLIFASVLAFLLLVRVWDAARRRRGTSSSSR